VDRQERPPVWPLVVGLFVAVLLLVGLFSVLGWIFRTATTLVVLGLIGFIVYLWLRK
jgi:hypothetical protein